MMGVGWKFFFVVFVVVSFLFCFVLLVFRKCGGRRVNVKLNQPFVDYIYF